MMPLTKELIEKYQNYNIVLICGTTSPFYVAEKSNPAKGVTLTDENLKSLKQKIDDTLDYAAKLYINVWEGVPQNKIFQQSRMRKVKLSGGLVILVWGDIDLDILMENPSIYPLRRSKRKKNGHINLAKFLKCRGAVCQNFSRYEQPQK